MVDKGATNQGKVTTIIGDIFKVRTGYAGYIVSNLASKDIELFVEDCNDKHMVPWARVRDGANNGYVHGTCLLAYLCLYIGPFVDL